MCRIACWVSVHFNSLMLFSEKIFCVCIIGSSAIKGKFYSNFQKNIMSFYESASVSADVIMTLPTEIYLSVFIETMNLQNLQQMKKQK